MLKKFADPTRFFALMSLILLATIACTSPEAAESPTAVANQATATPSPPPTAPTLPPPDVEAPPDLTTVDDIGATSVDTTAVADTPAAADPTTLSDAETAALLFMREEEKLAHDVYVTLYEQWGLNIFTNIAASELTHTNAVKQLLDRYGLADPATGSAVGVFVNTDLQALYDELIATGSLSLGDALRVGAAIEEIDILDLQAQIALTENADVVTVYQNLLKGSRNHLRAFTNVLAQQTGETYQPQYLSADAYQAIVGTETERGGPGGPGNGGGNRGNRNGQGAQDGQG